MMCALYILLLTQHARANVAQFRAFLQRHATRFAASKRPCCAGVA